MQYLEIIYVKELKNGEYKRDVESFPLETGFFTMKSHPLIKVMVGKIEGKMVHVWFRENDFYLNREYNTEEIISLGDNKELFISIVGEYEYKKEIYEVRYIDNATIQIIASGKDIDSYSSNNFQIEKSLTPKEGQIFREEGPTPRFEVKRVLSDKSLIIFVDDKEYTLELDKELKFPYSASMGYNDNFSAIDAEYSVTLKKINPDFPTEMVIKEETVYV